MRKSQASYDRSNAQLYGAFKYPILKNDDAVFLVGLIDDCVYRALKTLDDCTDFVRRQYAKVTVDALYKGTRKSFSSVDDHNLFAALPTLTDENWLDVVRNELIMYRGHWIHILSSFLKRYENYLVVAIDESERRKSEAMEAELDASSNSLYGAVAEVKHLMNRVSGILERMVRPYLRKIVSLAKTYARDPDVFFENYQNGYHGVLTAIGRYDMRIGAYAFIVEQQLRSRMVSGMSSLISMPDRLWKHKRLIDKNPNLEIEAIAKKEGIDVSLLQDSMHLLEVRNAMPLIEESDENADELECYHDAQADQEHDLALVKQQLAVYSKNIKQRDRLILSIAFDVDMFEGITVSQDELDKEAVRQLYAAQLTTAA